MARKVRKPKGEPRPRTSINLPVSLVTDARHIALEKHTTLSAIVEGLLREYVKGHGRGEK
jgi:hypothetical protein